MKNRVKDLRESRNLTQQELAEAVGVTRQMISYIEKGEKKPTIVLALKLAAFFGIKVEDLFSLEDTDS